MNRRANKYFTNRLSKCQIHMKMWSYSHLGKIRDNIAHKVEWQVLRLGTISDVGENIEQQKFLHNFHWDVNWSNLFGKINDKTTKPL